MFYVTESGNDILHEKDAYFWKGKVYSKNELVAALKTAGKTDHNKWGIDTTK